MAELLLGSEEQLVMSSHAKFSEYKIFGHFNTGDAFLTNRRFVFTGRVEIKTWFHLISVAAGKSRKYFEIPTSTLREVKKKRLENTIVVEYKEGAKTRKALLKPQETPYLDVIAGLGLGLLGGEIGEKIGGSLSGKFGDLVGGMIGGQAGGKAGEMSGETVKEIEGKTLSRTWLDAFNQVMHHQDHWMPSTVPAPGTDYVQKEKSDTDSASARSGIYEQFFNRMRHIFSVSTGNPPRMEVVTIGQIFEEELGKDFANFEIPVRRVTYLKELMDTIENARNPIDREIFSEQLRLYLQQLKRERDLFLRKKDQGS
ncbi:MAG: hypothetical protein HXS41_00345 [Theionarchaea archaeon]|nr:hypothetical protein [Theionarchaea archaeon]MBU7019480.1 hypothetical protein [Theionarchaea archaeon]MBU7035422.1 hypothetical protein [Theionarchaea archaeon]